MARGRKANLAVDTRPGRVLALALLACAPIFVAFILLPVLNRGDVSAARAYAPIVLAATPVLAILSVGAYVRAGEARAHRASRIGLLLAASALLLWGIALLGVLRT